MLRVRSFNRLLSIYSWAFLFLILISVTASGSIIYLHQDAMRQGAELSRLVQVIHGLRGDLYRQLKELFDYVFVGDPDAVVEFEEFNRQIELNMEELEKIGLDTPFAGEVENLRVTYGDVRNRARVIMNQPATQLSATQLLQVFETQLEKGRMLEYERAFQAIEALLGKAIDDINSRSDRQRPLILGVLVVPLVLGLLLLVISRRLLAQKVGRPIAGLLAAAEAYRGGELGYQVPEDGPAEFLTLQESMNRMAQDLKSSQKILVENEKQATLGALVPIVAHNIRNPLASIRATAQVIRDPSMPVEQVESLDGIVRTVDRLENWLTHLITYLNPLQPKPSGSSMSVVLDHALHLLSHDMKAKSLALQRRGTDSELGLLMDQSLIEQAVCGLVTNAIEASPKGADLIFEIEEKPNEVCLRIVDSGPGMPFAEGPSGLNPGPSTKSLGSGLGVPFARKVCEIHGGRVEFLKREGGGTITAVRLPRPSVLGPVLNTAPSG